MDLSGVAYNTADAMAVAVIVITAIGVLWGIRKAISFANRG